MTRSCMRPAPLATLTLLVLLVLAAGCGGDDGAEGAGGPAGTVQTFYGHLNAGRYDEALALYDAETRAVLTDPDATGEEGFAGWARQTTRDGSIAKVEIVSESTAEGGDGMRVEYDVHFSDGSSSRHTVTLSERDGGWRLGFIG